MVDVPCNLSVLSFSCCATPTCCSSPSSFATTRGCHPTPCACGHQLTHPPLTILATPCHHHQLGWLADQSQCVCDLTIHIHCLASASQSASDSPHTNSTPTSSLLR